MNQTQLKYVRQRAESIYSLRCKNLTNKFTQQSLTLKPEEIIEALQNGKFVLKTEIQTRYNSGYLRDYITFPDECPQIIDLDGLAVPQKTLKDEYQKLLDELILGDNEQALALLKAFEVE